MKKYLLSILLLLVVVAAPFTVKAATVEQLQDMLCSVEARLNAETGRPVPACYSSSTPPLFANTDIGLEELLKLRCALRGQIAVMTGQPVQDCLAPADIFVTKKGYSTISTGLYGMPDDRRPLIKTSFTVKVSNNSMKGICISGTSFRAEAVTDMAADIHSSSSVFLSNRIQRRGFTKYEGCNGDYLPPRRSGTYYITSTSFGVPISSMFAGQYYGRLKGVISFSNDASDYYQYYIPFNFRTDNTVVIVGEKSPYINYVSYYRDTVKVRGVRLSNGDVLNIGGSTEYSDPGITAANGQSIVFKLRTQPAPGVYPVWVQSRLGNSNILNLEFKDDNRSGSSNDNNDSGGGSGSNPAPASSSTIVVSRTPSSLTAGSNYNITWTDSNPERYYNILLRERGTNKQYTLKWYYDAGPVNNSPKVFTWNVGKMIDDANNSNAVDINPMPTSSNLYITVCHSHPGPCAYSDGGVSGNGFSITSPTTTVPSLPVSILSMNAYCGVGSNAVKCNQESTIHPIWHALPTDSNNDYYMACPKLNTIGGDPKYNHGFIDIDLGSEKYVTKIKMDFAANNVDSKIDYPASAPTSYWFTFFDANGDSITYPVPTSGSFNKSIEFYPPFSPNIKTKVVRFVYDKINDGTGWCLGLKKVEVLGTDIIATAMNSQYSNQVASVISGLQSLLNKLKYQLKYQLK